MDKFFLALDYRYEQEAIERGMSALFFLRQSFGRLVEGKLGVKVNGDLLTASVDSKLREFPDHGYDVFADLKLAHDPAMGEDVVRRVTGRNYTNLSVKYVTIFAGLGPAMLGDYARRLGGINLVAYTAHTKMDEKEALQAYNASDMDELMLRFGTSAHTAGFDSMVIDGERLKNKSIRDLPVKKLVTGVRLRTEERGDQSRMTLLGDLAKMKEHVDYVVVSSRYLSKPRELEAYFAELL